MSKLAALTGRLPSVLLLPLQLRALVLRQKRCFSTPAGEKLSFSFEADAESVEDVTNSIDLNSPMEVRKMVEQLETGNHPLTNYIEDPIQRAYVSKVEAVESAVMVERQRKISEIQGATNKTTVEKIRELITIGAPSRVVLQTMHNTLPRVVPSKKTRSNIDSMDIIGISREIMDEEFTPSGYDMEDSSDPETLPRMRSFTKDEMHKLLQDVEDSRFCMTEVEDQLMEPGIVLGHMFDEILKQKIKAGLLMLADRNPEAFDSELVPFDLTKKKTIIDLAEKDTPDLEGVVGKSLESNPDGSGEERSDADNGAQAPQVEYFSEKTIGAVKKGEAGPSPRATAKMLGTLDPVSGPSSARATGSDGDVNKSGIPVRAVRAVQQHNASAAVVNSNGRPADNASSKSIAEVAVTNASDWGQEQAHTLRSAPLLSERVPRDPRLLTATESDNRQTDQVEKVIESLLIKNPKSTKAILASTTLSDHLRKLTSGELEKFVENAMRLKPDEFKTKITEFAEAFRETTNIANDTGPMPVAEILQRLDSGVGKGGQAAVTDGNAIAKQTQDPDAGLDAAALRKKYNLRTEPYRPVEDDMDDGDRWDMSPVPAHRRYANTPGLTLGGAEEMLKDVVAKDVWASYHERRLPQPYYTPVVISGNYMPDKATLAERAEDPFPDPNRAPRTVDEEVTRRANAFIHSNLIPRKKLKSLRKGLELYSGIPPELLEKISARTDSLYPSVMPLHEDRVKEEDQRSLERLKAREILKPLFTRDQLEGRRPGESKTLRESAATLDSKDTCSEDEIADISSRKASPSELRRAEAQELKKLGVAVPEAALELQPGDLQRDMGIGSDQADTSGFDFDTDLDGLMEEAQDELARRQQSDMEPNTEEDPQATLDVIQQMRDARRRRPLPGSNTAHLNEPKADIPDASGAQENVTAAKPENDDPDAQRIVEDFLFEVNAWSKLMREEQASALRRIFELDPALARSLVQKVASMGETPGSVADKMRQKVEEVVANGGEIKEDIKKPSSAKNEQKSTPSLPSMEKILEMSVDFVSELRKLEERLFVESAKARSTSTAKIPPNIAAGPFHRGEFAPVFVDSYFEESEHERSTSSSAPAMSKMMKSSSQTPTSRDSVSGNRNVAVGVATPHAGGTGSAIAPADVAREESSRIGRAVASTGATDSKSEKAASSDDDDDARSDRLSRDRGSNAKGKERELFGVPGVEEALEPLPNEKNAYQADRAVKLAGADPLELDPLLRKVSASHFLHKYKAAVDEAKEDERAAKTELRLYEPPNEEDGSEVVARWGLRRPRGSDPSVSMAAPPPMGGNLSDGPEEVDEEEGGDQTSDHDGERVVGDWLKKARGKGANVPGEVQAFVSTLSEGQAEKLAADMLERHDKLFFEGQLEGDDYAAALIENKELEYEYGFGSSDEDARDNRAFRRELMLGALERRAEQKDEQTALEDSASVLREPDVDKNFALNDEDEVGMSRRLQPYDQIPHDESNLPPVIGIEQQTNLYNLHKLDPATFHPRWLARRLNVAPSAIIAILKSQDLLHKLNVWDVRGTTKRLEEADDLMDPMPGPDGDTQEIHPPELNLGESDDEVSIASEAPHQIGRVSWDDSIFKDPAWLDPPNFADVRIVPDDELPNLERQKSRRAERWASREERLDAIERLSFARFGPVHWASGRNTVHRPPKLPREVVSSMVHPPSRKTWVLTGIGEKKKNTFSILVRDRDGYLRHPTFREFRRVRYREKDARLRFNWRRYNVLAKVPEISSLFVQQVTQLTASHFLADSESQADPPELKETKTDDPFGLLDEMAKIQEQEQKETYENMLKLEEQKSLKESTV